MPPATGHEVVQDIRDLFAFIVHADISSESNSEMTGGTVPNIHANRPTSSAVRLGRTFRIDPEAIAVAGSSAGGLCAYLAAMHCVFPRPKAILSMYGMGGDFFVRKSCFVSRLVSSF